MSCSSLQVLLKFKRLKSIEIFAQIHGRLPTQFTPHAVQTRLPEFHFFSDYNNCFSSLTMLKYHDIVQLSGHLIFVFPPSALRILLLLNDFCRVHTY